VTLILPELPSRVAAAIASTQRAAEQLPAIRAVALVGSWARGAGRDDSDVDIVVLSNEPAVLLGATEWISGFYPGADLIRTNDFGAIQERRLRLPDDLVVELGIGAIDWARAAPPDPGTRRVARDGLVPLHDPDAILQALLAAL
jgi:predicted nucleotidyltransferase